MTDMGFSKGIWFFKQLLFAHEIIGLHTSTFAGYVFPNLDKVLPLVPTAAAALSLAALQGSNFRKTPVENSFLGPRVHACPAS
jgi:hypothetical protein